MQKVVLKAISALLVFAIVVSCGALSFAAQTPTDIPQGESKFIKPVTSLTEVPDGYTAIRTAAELDAIRNNLKGNYIMMNDIDLAEFGNWMPVEGYLEGVLNGNGHVIKNVRIDSIVATKGIYDYKTGLFAGAATVFNLGVENIKITVSSDTELCAGAIVAEATKIVNCYATGSLNVSAVDESVSIGGLVGIALRRIDYCKNSVSISASCGDTESYIGGVMGWGLHPFCCENYGDVTVTSNGAEIGGIVGMSNTVTNGCNFGKLTVTGTESVIGGIVGTTESIIESCYNLGEIKNMNNPGEVGGVCGYINFDANMSYLLNPLSEWISDYRHNNSVFIKNCYYLNSAGDILMPSSEIRSSGNIVNCKALSADEMKRQASFDGFDFENDWTMPENGTPVISSKLATLKSTVTSIPNRDAEFCDNDEIEIIAGFSSNLDVAYIYTGSLQCVNEGNATVTFITSDGQYGECEVVVQYTPIQRLLITLFGWLDPIVKLIKLILYPIMPITII